MIDIKLDTSGLNKLANELEHLDFKPAISRALNRAGDMAVTQVGRTLAQETGLGVRQVRESIDVDRASPADLAYTITVSGRHIPLGEFGARETRAGVSARPWGQRRVFPGSFMIDGDVVARVGEERLPLRKLWGPSLAVEAGRENVFKDVIDMVQEHFSRRLAHEVSRIMPGGGSKGGGGD
jgi:hypothetical protein